MNNNKKTEKESGRRLPRRTVLTLVLGVTLIVLAGPGPVLSQPAPGRPITDLIRSLEVGRPVSHGHLTIVPVYLTRVRLSTEFVPFDEAVRNGWVEIAELDGGRVPQVKISNRSKRTIFLMGGEILTGAKQDRILASDLLLGPGTTDLVIPVYCVEHGRWTQTSGTFTTKGNIGTFALRAKAQLQEVEAQSAIWDKISEENRKMGVAAPTSAYQAAYDAAPNKEKIQVIEEKMAAIPRLYKDTVGVVIALGGRVVSVDIFANPALFTKQWPKILRSSALSALTHETAGVLDQRAAAALLRTFPGQDYQIKKGLDLGMEYASAATETNIKALVYEGGVLHLAAFPQEDERLKVIEDRTDDQRIRVIREEE
jgi:ARG and Rhodanese-Phosphatase-superfamily-associated Protein domain